MRSNSTYRVLILPAVLAWAAVAVGQVSETEPSPPTVLPRSSDDDAPPRVVEGAPRYVYARNAKGEEVPFIDITAERIQMLLDRADGGIGRRRPPQYQLDRLEIDGRTEQNRAILDVVVDVTTLNADETDKAKWVAIPLRMHDSSLVEPPTYVEGDGQMFLSQDESDGYQAWIRFKETGQHKIRLRFWTNLSKAALATQLRFLPPVANVSRLRLNVVGSPINADIENGANLLVSRGEDSRSILTATDLRHQVAVVWRDGNTDTQPKTAYLDARGDIQVSIDGPGAIRSNVTLDVKSYSGVIETFALRLPPYTTIVAVTDEDYQITELNTPTFKDGDNRRTVQVTLDKPSPQVQLQFTTQTTIGNNGGEAPQAEQLINVASFEVLDALQQAGRISLLASEDWLVYWYLGSSVRRVPGPGESDAASELMRLATFEYFRQPCRLDLDIKPQSTRVNVEPIYRIKVEEDRVVLEATLRYKIRGARVSFLDFALNGWQLDDVGPSTTVANDHFQDNSDPNVTLRLTQPRTGEVDLVLNLHRRVTEREGTLRFPLPWPTSDSHTPGVVLVTAADAIKLDFRTQEMVGLVQDTVPNDIGSATRLSSTQSLAAFRIRHDREPGDVVIDYQVREQEVTVRSDTLVDVSSSTANVSQQFSYRVLYEPASRLTLDIPRPLYEWMANPRNRNQVELDVAGRQIGSDTLLDANNGSFDGESSSLSVPLDQPLLGSFVVRLQFPWKLGTYSEFQRTKIPLVTPREGRLLSNTAKLSAKGRSRIELTEDIQWEEDDNATTLESSQAFALRSQERRDGVAINVKQIAETDDAVVPGTTVVHLAWLQTWLSRSERRDRAVYLIKTGADRVFLELPTDGSPQVDGALQVIVLVDGREATATFGAANELEIRIPQGARRNHTVEVSFRYPSRPDPGRIRFAMPSFRDAKPVERWFWQLVLPSGEDLLLTDTRLTSENRWRRDGWTWRRTASMTQPTLEYMTGASTQAAVPYSANQYLFSSFDQIGKIDVRTCRRRVLAYSTSSVILLVGIGLIYIPVVRQPIVLMVIGVGLATAAAILPSASVLIAQASLLGCVLVVFSLLILGLMRWLANRRMAGYPRQSEPPSGIQSSWRDGSQPATATVTVQSLPVVVPDSKA